MNSDQIDARLEAVKATAGKNDKIAMLKESLEDDAFREAVVLMLDPRLRFGVAKTTIDKVCEIAMIHSKEDLRQLDVYDIEVLHRMADGWVTGGDAKDQIAAWRSNLTPGSFAVIVRILLKKPDGGFTEGSVNKARPGTVFSFDCMLAHKFEAKRIKTWPVAMEPKIDGVRCLIMVRPTAAGTDIEFFSRTGKPFTSFGGIKDALRLIVEGRDDIENSEGFILDCEIDSGSFNETVSQARRKDEEAVDAVARCFDILTFSEWQAGKSNAPYIDRRKALLNLVNDGRAPRHPRVQAVPLRIGRKVEDCEAYNAEIHGAGGEGIIVKPLDHLYECKRSYSWLKMKASETHDLVITGFFEGERKYEGMLGGVIVDFNGVEVRVGGGWSDEDRAHIWADQGAFLGRMIEVKAHEQTPDGSLRHPVFVRWRDDKHDKDAA